MVRKSLPSEPTVMDDGPPGIRSQYHGSYRAAYGRDPNGYKIEVGCQQIA
ncbi:MAG: hypothetical protein F6K31_29265 [Symploca sp. SIO2G7]|nr:hypothetical protein [Symploca sp. SIO2G7]